MNTKKFILASIAVFFTAQITDQIVHNLILGKTYMAMPDVWRPDMMSKMWIMILTAIAFSFLFVYIFTKGYENKGIAEGIRYGIIIGLFMNVVAAFNQYALYAIPFSLAIQWFVFGMIQFIVYGIVTAAIYKPKEKL